MLCVQFSLLLYENHAIVSPLFSILLRKWDGYSLSPFLLLFIPSRMELTFPAANSSPTFIFTWQRDTRCLLQSDIAYLMLQIYITSSIAHKCTHCLLWTMKNNNNDDKLMRAGSSTTKEMKWNENKRQLDYRCVASPNAVGRWNDFAAVVLDIYHSSVCA